MSAVSAVDPQGFIMYDPALNEEIHHEKQQPIRDLENPTANPKKSDSWFS